MIGLKQDIKLGETLLGVVKDNLGNEVEVCAYYGRFEFIMCTTKIGVPICSVMVRNDGLCIEYEDNEFRGINLSRTVRGVAAMGEFKKEFEIKGQMVKVESYIGDMLCVVNATSPVVCMGVKDDGEIINHWCDVGYRASDSLDIYIDIIHGVAISKGWFGKGIEKFFAYIPVEQIPAIKFAVKVGCQLRGQVMGNGVKYNIYGYTAQSRIDRATETALREGIAVESWK
jgi:hypothetical protein